MTTEEIMKRAIAERGYGVIASLEQKQTGDLISVLAIGQDDEFTHPFVVTTQTDRADYEEQCRLVGEPTHLNAAYQYFSRVTDAALAAVEGAQ